MINILFIYMYVYVYIHVYMYFHTVGNESKKNFYYRFVDITKLFSKCYTSWIPSNNILKCSFYIALPTLAKSIANVFELFLI
jgi:uncharacterized protein YfaT (DUF1175 family)